MRSCRTDAYGRARQIFRCAWRCSRTAFETAGDARVEHRQRRHARLQSARHRFRGGAEAGRRRWRGIAGDKRGPYRGRKARVRRRRALRSEEHTSELQSLMRISYAVLFLTKKTSSTHKTSLAYTYHTY